MTDESPTDGNGLSGRFVEKFFQITSIIETTLCANIGASEVSASGYGDEYVEPTGGGRYRLDGEFDLHALAGLITRELLRQDGIGD